MVIGDEILSGRTKDTNSNTIALFLSPLGIKLQEVRVVADEEWRIIKALNELRHENDYVFTTGGIGPTHDDITADAIAKAFDVGISEHEDALKCLREIYSEEDLTPARRRMARIPDGATLIDNPVSHAPGFQIGNVFVLAGVPRIMNAMLADVGYRLQQGEVVHSRTLKTRSLREGDIAESLGNLAKEMPDLSFGSYPWYYDDGFGTQLVARGTDTKRLEIAVKAMEKMIVSLGLFPDIL